MEKKPRRCLGALGNEKFCEKPAEPGTRFCKSCQRRNSETKKIGSVAEDNGRALTLAIKELSRS